MSKSYVFLIIMIFIFPLSCKESKSLILFYSETVLLDKKGEVKYQPYGYVYCKYESKRFKAKKYNYVVPYKEGAIFVFTDIPEGEFYLYKMNLLGKFHDQSVIKLDKFQEYRLQLDGEGIHYLGGVRNEFNVSDVRNDDDEHEEYQYTYRKLPNVKENKLLRAVREAFQNDRTSKNDKWVSKIDARLKEVEFSVEITGHSLEKFVKAHKKKLPTVDELESMNLTEYNVSSENKKSFVTWYGKFLTEHKRIRKEFHHFPEVTVFAVQRFNENSFEMYKEPHWTTSMDADNDRYVGFMLLTGAGVDYEKISDEKHVELLAESYGISPFQIRNGIWKTLVEGSDMSISYTIGMINENLNKNNYENVKDYAQHLLLPYLTLRSRGYTITDTIDTKLITTMEKVYGITDGAFKKYIDAFGDYVNGYSLDNKFAIALNNQLKKHGIRISMDKNRCVVYQINRTVSLNTNYLRDVLFVKRHGVSLLGIDKGQAVYGAKDITLTENYISDEVNDITIILSSDSLPSSYGKGADRLWKSIKVSLNVKKANSLYRTLLRKDFKGLSDEEIQKIIERDIVIHEGKHKFDELINRKRKWLNVDMEVSAHLAQIVYGTATYNNIFSFVNRIQGYYGNIRSKSVKKKLRPLIKKSWHLIQLGEQGKMSESQLRKEFKKLYVNYITLKGKRLPKLTKFEQDVVAVVKKKM